MITVCCLQIICQNSGKFRQSLLVRNTLIRTTGAIRSLTVNWSVNEMKDNVSIGNVIKFAGAYIACAIGSGFATGQEVMQFFSGQGIWAAQMVIRLSTRV